MIRKIFITFFIVFLFLEFSQRMTLAQCTGPAPTPKPGYVCCDDGFCADGSRYWTYCDNCTASRRTCYDNPSCGSPPDCKDDNTCLLPGYGRTPEDFCCPLEAHCGDTQPPGCGIVHCDVMTGGCYSDCTACCPNINSYVNPNPVSPNSSFTFIFTSPFQYTSVGFSPHGGISSCTYNGSKSSGNPKDSYKYWWKWTCTSFTTPGNYQAVFFSDAVGCDEYVDYTVANQPPSCLLIDTGPTTVSINSSNTYTATATDPEGDSLSYSWSLSPVGCGSFVGPTNLSTVNWTAPSTAQTCRIMAQVTDGVNAPVNCPSKVVDVINPVSYPAWWQAKEGDVHANRDISNYIPSSTPPPYLCLDGAASFPGVISNSGSVDLHNSDPSLKVSRTEWQVNGETSENLSGFGINNTLYDYHYFDQKLPTSRCNFDGSRPTVDPINCPEGIYKTPLLTDITVNNQWPNITSSEKFVILVDGNLTFTKKIAVDPGGFIAFIVKGDIILDRAVGENPASSSDKTLEGVYIADGFIRSMRVSDTPDTNKRFNGGGIFIAYGGFDLRRDLGNRNDQNPSEYFEYRPDFLINFPKEFAEKPQVWQESAP